MIRRLHMISRVILGLVFVLSGALKIVSPQQAADLLNQISSVKGEAGKGIVIFGSVVELIVGAILLVNRKYSGAAAFGTSILLLVFTFVGLWALENPVPCGCFGDVVDFRTDEYFIARNLGFLLLSIFVFRYSNNISHNQLG
jgi:uncharacterized membrane protein YphA (DoxX/SURF4 family)